MLSILIHLLSELGGDIDTLQLMSLQPGEPRSQVKNVLISSKLLDVSATQHTGPTGCGFLLLCGVEKRASNAVVMVREETKIQYLKFEVRSVLVLHSHPIGLILSCFLFCLNQVFAICTNWL